MFWNVLHLTAEWNVILLKNDEVIDLLTSPPTDFSALKNVQAEMLFNFYKKSELMLMRRATASV